MKFIQNSCTTEFTTNVYKAQITALTRTFVSVWFLYALICRQLRQLSLAWREKLIEVDRSALIGANK